MFSKTCKYAIRAVIFIAHKSADGSRVGIKEIAKGIDSPEHFIAKILQDLGKRGLVQSLKGPNGGFYLDEVSKKHTLADVVEAIDGDGIFTGCALGLKQCSEIKPCPLHSKFKTIREQLQIMLGSVTVENFNDELNAGISYLRRN
ncbi:Rrf2 family transcriptional regulator [Pedobacter sp. BS3]|uniref:RrF2 family transcriptional regulator n=1 Tax=Pedobacter sp. BS3 TaxID=2567937 RepID=UPI0011EEA8FB|nr:Rrf2 family transcriptional regulator [Pedobacter sp. BS3]TZF84043.1 Rrf2 family transcriptional regulator [Pedobacter sp. BS3]